MSLDFNVSKIVDKAINFPADEHGKMNDALHVLIWSTMAVEIGEITEDNYIEFHARLDVWYKVVGPMFHKAVSNDDSEELEWVPFMPTLEDVHHAVGLSTNAANGMNSRKEFFDKVLNRAYRI